jgi:hypothetical protein
MTLRAALALAVLAPVSRAQNMTAAETHGLLNQNFDKAELHLLPVQGNVYMLVGDGANIAVQIGKQGVLLVDTGFAQLSGKLAAAVAQLSDKPIRYIISANSFADRVGGNEPVRRAGITVTGANVAANITDAGAGAALLAHENVLTRMSAPTGKVSPTPAGAWPTDTFFGPEKPLYFRRSDVIDAGDLFNTDSYPVIDIDKGGTIEGVVQGLNRIVKLAIVAHEEEGGTLVIPGHGHLCDQAEVVEYRDMVTIVRDRIQAMIKKGMTLEQVKAARPTLDYDPLYDTNDFWTADNFVTAAYKSLTTRP